MSPTAGDAYTVCAETLVTPYRLMTPGWVTVSGSTVAALGAGQPPQGGAVIDFGDGVIVPGFVDLHVHGATGAEVNGVERHAVADAVRRTAAYHALHGTTALLPTTVSDSQQALVETIRGIGLCVDLPPGSGGVVLGAHLEGPWLAPARAGAHDPRHLRPPTARELRVLLEAAPGVVRMITIAPELAGALDVIVAMTAAGVVASIGHTDADVDGTLAAVDAGARHVTHLFNAMPPLHHRRPGPAGAVLTEGRLSLDVIADGVHVDPLLLTMVLRLARGRVVVVTDATSATGLGSGRHALGGRHVELRDGSVFLAGAPDTLAGSVLTMDRAVANLVDAGIALTDAVTAATAAPAGVLGDGERGVIRVGARADLAILDSRLSCRATVVGGVPVFDVNQVLPKGRYSPLDG